MLLLSAYITFCCLTLSSHCYQLNKALCEGSSCFSLYEGGTASVTWDQSYQACSNEGLQMSVIESNQTQTVVDRLLQDLPLSTERKVWIGGRRSDDNTWRFMNGTMFNNTVNDPTSQTRLHCLYVRLCKGIKPEYHAHNCDEKTSSSRLLCQYCQSKTSGCRSSDIHYGNKCYMKTSFGGNGTRIDWYKGQTYCSQSDVQGDIAYSYLDNDTLINNIIDLVHPGYKCAQLWLGVRRRIWFWKTDSMNDEDHKPIRYYNWDDGTKVDSSDADCIYIDVDKRYKWLATSCTSLPRQHFMCMKEIIPTSTTVTSTHTTTTTSSFDYINTTTVTSTSTSISLHITETKMNTTIVLRSSSLV